MMYDAKQISDAMKVINSSIETYKPSKMEFSKKLIIGFFSFCCATGLILIFIWYLTGDWPAEIIQNVLVPLAATVIGYCCKSGYENRAKIEKGGNYDA